MFEWLARVALSVMLAASSFGVPVSTADERHPVEVTQAPLPAVQSLVPDSFAVGAKAALLIDLNSGKQLLSKNSDAALPMASLTKLMTGYVILKHHSLDEVVTVGPAVSTIGGDSQRLNIKEGEQFTLREMMEGLLIYSANDVAVALASWDAGTEQAFVDKMNATAKDLGMDKTRFANASGLDAEGHVSSAHDLSIIARIMLESDSVRATVKQASAVMRTTSGKPYTMTTTNQLLTQNSEVQGLKTGYTIKAGECLIAYAVKDQRRVLSVVLGSPDRFQESNSLIHLALDRLE